MRLVSSILIAFAMSLAAPVARAKPVAQPVAQSEPAPGTAPEPEQLPAETVGHAPPGEESGRVDEPETDSTGRRIARGALLVPKLLVTIVLAPVHGAVWVYDRYQLGERYYDTFFNKDRTFGITPSAYYATGLGFTAGAHLISRNTFGQQERIEAYGMWGGTYRLRAGGSIDSGNRFGKIVLGVGGGFVRLPDNPFFGIGNANTEDAPPGMLINPQTSSAAVETFNRYQIAAAGVSAAVSVVDGLAVIAHASYIDLDYSPSTSDPSIQDVYNPMQLVGFTTGVHQAYTQGELRWDTRAPGSAWEPQELHSVGTYLDAFGGWVDGFSGSSSYGRYGFDAQQFFRLGAGPRVLELRVYGEAVTGSTSQVPFSELPHLGGDFLRGYVYDRFRDRIAALATAQYYWDVSSYADLYVFADVGRVYGSYNDITWRGMRAGFGPGIEIHSSNQFLVEAYLGFSIDGDVTVSAAFTPIVDRRSHWW
jgi:hypothetical protein